MRFFDLVADITKKDTEALAELVRTALSLYTTYASILPLPKFREKIAILDANIGALLEMIYVKKIVSRKELQQRLREVEYGSSTLYGRSALAERVAKSLKADASDILPSDEVELFLQRGGAIYKRSLSKDLNKLLPN